MVVGGAAGGIAVIAAGRARQAGAWVADRAPQARVGRLRVRDAEHVRAAAARGAEAGGFAAALDEGGGGAGGGEPGDHLIDRHALDQAAEVEADGGIVDC